MGIAAALRAEQLAIAQVALAEATAEDIRAGEEEGRCTIAQSVIDSLDGCTLSFERVPVRPIPTQANLPDAPRADFETGAVRGKRP